MTGCFDGADTTKISPEAVARGVDQIGTLGSGRPGPPCFTTLSDITARKQAEYALRQSEARMRSIVETAVDGIITINEQGGIESFNPAAERLFGYRAAEVIGKNVTLLIGVTILADMLREQKMEPDAPC